MLRCLVRRLTLYLLAQMAAALAVAVLLLCGLTWALQALRLGHHLTGALEAGLVGRLVLFSLPTLLVLTLPLGAAAAVLFSLGQLAETGELEAARALGASPLLLALPAVLLTTGVLGASLAAARLEAPALGALHRSLADGATRSLLGSIRSGEFRRLPGEVVIYAERRLGPGRFGGVMMARAGQVLLVQEARFEQRSPGRLRLHLRQGELHLLGEPRARRKGHRAAPPRWNSGAPKRSDPALTRVRFGTLEQTLDLRPRLRRHFGFLTPERRRTDPLATATTTLALGLLATVVGLSGRRRRGVIIAGLGVVVAVQLLSWVANGPILPAVVALGCVGWLVWISRP